MLEQIYDTIQGIIFLELPKNANGQPVVYDKAIVGWKFGDRTVQPGMPQITLQGSTSDPRPIGTGTYLYEHVITVSFAVAEKSASISERNVLEYARLINNVLLSHRRMWVLCPCPVCGVKILNPQHFTDAHPTIFAPYSTAAISQFNTIWAQTHSGTPPTLDTPGVDGVALLLAMNDVQAGTQPSSIAGSTLSTMQSYIANKRDPVRLIDEVRYTSVKPSDAAKETQMYRSGEFTISAREVYRQIAYGPNNVPTTGWAPR